MTKKIAVVAVTICLTLWCPSSEGIIEQGPKPPAPAAEVSRGEARYLVVVMEATAYIETGSKTFSCTWPEVGRTVAVDPRVIPLGTRIYIEGFGWRVAEDTGEAIKGNKIDIYMDSKVRALDFGRRPVVVKIPVTDKGGERFEHDHH
jgi:3D (Asp-Asp-Asp) domain-containing protein